MNHDNTENEVTIESEDNFDENDEGLQITEPFDPSEIKIISKQDTLRNIIERLKQDEIDMNTDFQRHAELWDNRKMSRLIESILIRFPLPAFYFDASDDDKWLIVDGLQRLSSIRKFVIDKKLKLRGIEYIIDFEGKNYDALPRTYQRRIDECPVTLFLIQPGTPKKVKYSIFRRINTGGLTLNDQEIRNAMTVPFVREYLENLAKDDTFIKIMGDQSRRMLDQELALRFMAFYYLDYELSKKNISNFLDDMVSKLEHFTSEQQNRLNEAFKVAILRNYKIFGDNAFEKTVEENTSKRKRKNSTLFEVWTTTMAKMSEEDFLTLSENKDMFLVKYHEMLQNDNDFIRSITYSTQKKEHYRIRKEKIENLIQETLNLASIL